LALASCGARDVAPVASANLASSDRIADYPLTIGEPFMVGTVKYTPADTALYDEVGLAGWYAGNDGSTKTANGEEFSSTAITAAHKTLPLPSYVEVTALDTGRTILVRINDRGPMTNERLIDLSEGAARQLGIVERNVSGVRVRRVNPPEAERSALRSGVAASARMDTPESLLKVLREKLAKQAPPIAPSVAAAKTAPAKTKPEKVATAIEPKTSKNKAQPQPAASTAYVVQVAAFASRNSADALAKKLNAQVASTPDGKLHRVRFGPFTDEKAAQSALGEARKRGYPQARLLRDQL
jgi:rare lipoprotein A